MKKFYKQVFIFIVIYLLTLGNAPYCTGCSVIVGCHASYSAKRWFQNQVESLPSFTRHTCRGAEGGILSFHRGVELPVLD